MNGAVAYSGIIVVVLLILIALLFLAIYIGIDRILEILFRGV